MKVNNFLLLPQKERERLIKSTIQEAIDAARKNGDNSDLVGVSAIVFFDSGKHTLAAIGMVNANKMIEGALSIMKHKESIRVGKHGRELL